MVHCDNCSKELGDQEKFCSNCGAKNTYLEKVNTKVTGTGASEESPDSRSSNTIFILIIVILFIVAIGGIAASVFLRQSYLNANTRLISLEKLNMELRNSYNADDSTLEFYRSHYMNGVMKIKNDGSEKLTLTSLIAVCSSGNGVMRKISGSVNQDILPNETITVSKFENDATDKIDSVVSYACYFKYKGAVYLQSGIWSMDISHDQAFHINYDKSN